MGGSLGLAVKRFQPGAQVVGVGRDPGKLAAAHRMGAIDEWQAEPEADLGGCDLVVLATPVEHILSTLPTLAGRLGEGAVVTDVGSTKRLICETAWTHLPSRVEFVGGHPVAGRELSGIENSVAGLYEGAPYVLCPRSDASRGLDRLLSLVEGLGARPFVMSAEEHDRTLAWVSHVPQLLSTALADLVRDRNLETAGSGLRDMTRLAGSPYSVWKSILESNRDNIDEAIGEVIAYLGDVRAALGRDLSEQFRRASEVHRRLGDVSGRDPDRKSQPQHR